MIASVVVASNRDPALLDACLASLLGQCRLARACLIVARPAGSFPPFDQLQQKYPEVQFVAAPTSDIPALRGAGLAEATGPATALTEDHCVAAADWLEQMSAAMTGADVVGGGMGNARERRAVDWAAFFAEYGFFSWARPLDPSATARPLLTGANVAYAESVRARVAEWARAGLWEDVAHARLHADGKVLRFAPAARILQNKQYGVWSFCRDRYEHGRDYARVRLTEQGTAHRWLMFAATPVLGLLLTSRVARASAAQNRAAFIRALPWTLGFLSAWSMGEAVGYLRGPAPRT